MAKVKKLFSKILKSGISSNGVQDDEEVSSPADYVTSETSQNGARFAEQVPKWVSIDVHPLTDTPTLAWYELQKDQRIQVLDQKQLIRKGFDVAGRRLRIVCMSDTHSLWNEARNITVPDGDILLHAGDMTMSGKYSQFHEFNEYMGRLPHKHKIVIAGNHDVLLDSNFSHNYGSELEKKHLQKNYGVDSVRELFSNCTYLQDELIEVEGLRIYGSPWKPDCACDAFFQDRGEDMLERWNQIPDNVDILMTHSPPVGIGDLVKDKYHVGCVELLNTVQKRVKPRFHVFGHIHEGYGAYTDGTTCYINASFCTFNYKPRNPPIVFDIDIPNGCEQRKEAQRVVMPCGAIRMEKRKTKHL